MISGGIEVNKFALIYLILEVKFGDNPQNLPEYRSTSETFHS